jgi:uncharacterized protein (TIGR00288 family)
VKDLDNHKKIAVLVDADNAQYSKMKHVIEEVSAHGHVVVKRAYGDWSNDCLKNWKNCLNELAIQPIQQFAYTTGKNATDASMIIDAMDLLYSNKFDAFALVSSDSDFTKLASRLRESEIFVFGVGEKKTPISFRNACDDFIFTENLGDEIRNEATATETAFESDKSPGTNEIISLLMKAWELYQDDSGWSNLGPAGNFLKRSKPDFDPRSYGASKLRQLVEGLDSYFELKEIKQNGSSKLLAYRAKKSATTCARTKR